MASLAHRKGVVRRAHARCNRRPPCDSDAANGEGECRGSRWDDPGVVVAQQASDVVARRVAIGDVVVDVGVGVTGRRDDDDVVDTREMVHDR